MEKESHNKVVEEVGSIIRTASRMSVDIKSSHRIEDKDHILDLQFHDVNPYSFIFTGMTIDRIKEALENNNFYLKKIKFMEEQNSVRVVMSVIINKVKLP